MISDCVTMKNSKKSARYIFILCITSKFSEIEQILCNLLLEGFLGLVNGKYKSEVDFSKKFKTFLKLFLKKVIAGTDNMDMKFSIFFNS